MDSGMIQSTSVQESSGRNRPSSKDVALRAGVSRATVSAYINGTRYVSPELGLRIEQAIRELNYTPDPLARALKVRDGRNSISRGGTPVVQINRRAAGMSVDSVVSNNASCIHRATKHLIQRGRTRIALLRCVPDNLSDSEKRSGFEAAINEAPGVTGFPITLEKGDQEAVFQSFEQVLRKIGKIDGLVCTTQNKTAIALKILQGARVEIPKDISVIGYDNTLWSSLLSPPLTVISEDIYEMGKQAVNLLLNRIEKRELGEPQNIVLENEFIIRESV
ncbi:MAG: LacI family DNA-binding transcriptional regulator [Bacillota bacterium]